MQHALDAFGHSRRTIVPRSVPPRCLRGNGVLVLGDHRQALAIARSLAGAGYRVIAGRDGRHTILERSRCVAEVWEHPRAADRDAWADALDTFCRARPDVGAVFPVGAHEIDLVMPLAARLPVLVVAAAPEILGVCRSKRALLALADCARVPTQPWAVVRDTSALLAELTRLGLPAVLKPDLQHDELGFKAVILRRRADALGLAQRIAFPTCGFVLQRVAPGVRHNVYFVAHAGLLLGVAQVRIVRTDRPDGTGLAVEGVSVRPDPALVEWTAALARELDYTGAGCAQFMLDAATSTASFLEINARLGANCAAVCACGLDLPRLFIETLLGGTNRERPAQVGRRYAWIEGDFYGLAASLRAGRVGWREAGAWLARASVAQLRAQDQIVWSWRDPLPTLATLGLAVQAALRRLAHGR